MKAAGTAVSLTAGGLILAAISNGEELFTMLRAAVDFLSYSATKMPLGAAWFGAALVAGMALMHVLRRFIPDTRRQDLMHLRLTFIELTSMLASFFVYWLNDKTLIGAVGGLAASALVSVAYRAVASLLSALARRVTLG